MGPITVITDTKRLRCPVELPRRQLAEEFELSDRDSQVLTLLLGGLTDREAAARLGISESRASHLVAGILRKLGCRNRTDVLALLALRAGLFERPSGGSVQQCALRFVISRREPVDAEDVAAALATRRDRVETALEALVDAGHLRRRGDRYRALERNAGKGAGRPPGRGNFEAYPLPIRRRGSKS